MPWWGECIHFIGRWVTLFPIVIGLIQVKRLNKPLLAIYIWMITMGAIQLYSTWQGSNGMNNIPSRHLMVFFNAGFGGYFFHHILKRKSYKLFVLITSITLLLFIWYNAFFIQTIQDLNPIPMAIMAYGLMVWSFIYLFELLRNDDVINLFESPEFYVVMGILLYFGTTQLVQLLQFYVSKHIYELRYLFRYVDISFMIVYYLLVGIGLWKKR